MSTNGMKVNSKTFKMMTFALLKQQHSSKHPAPSGCFWGGLLDLEMVFALNIENKDSKYMFIYLQNCRAML